jgi:uncharacterized membrane protein YfcA
MIIAFNSLFGFLIGLGGSQPVPWMLLGSLILIAVVGLLTGMKFSSRIPERSLKKGFGWFVLANGCYVLLRQVLGTGG